MLVLALGTDIKISRTQPIPIMTAFITYKAIGPLELEQILVTALRVREPDKKKGILPF